VSFHNFLLEVAENSLESKKITASPKKALPLLTFYILVATPFLHRKKSKSTPPYNDESQADPSQNPEFKKIINPQSIPKYYDRVKTGGSTDEQYRNLITSSPDNIQTLSSN
jgi:hypothetical protein